MGSCLPNREVPYHWRGRPDYSALLFGERCPPQLLPLLPLHETSFLGPNSRPEPQRYSHQVCEEIHHLYTMNQNFNQTYAVTATPFSLRPIAGGPEMTFSEARLVLGPYLLDASNGLPIQRLNRSIFLERLFILEQGVKIDKHFPHRTPWTRSSPSHPSQQTGNIKQSRRTSSIAQVTNTLEVYTRV